MTVPGFAVLRVVQFAQAILVIKRVVGSLARQTDDPLAAGYLAESASRSGGQSSLQRRSPCKSGLYYPIQLHVAQLGG